MTILNNKNKAIQFSQPNIIHENKESSALHTVFTYSPELPVITCSSKIDAEYIQQKINAFVRELSNEILNI